MLLSIKTPADYERAMNIIETYLTKDSVDLTEADLAELQRISLLVERYEDEHYPMPDEI